MPDGRTRAEHKKMILTPTKWPLFVLPLIRQPKFEDGNNAIFCPPFSKYAISSDEPIEILIGTMFDNLTQLPPVPGEVER